jgi:beta-barrel assembly-enhancing protease
MIKSIFPLLLCLTILSACGVNPVTGKQELQLTSEKKEIALGEKNFQSLQQVLGGPYNADPKVQEYLQKVGEKLVRVADRPNLPYEFILVNSSAINAATLPGGKIVINRGILTKLHNEAELAALLGHEIVHAAARHTANGMDNQLLFSLVKAGVTEGFKTDDENINTFVDRSATVATHLLQKKYSRRQEFEADKYGMKYMALAGYNTDAAVDLQKMFVELSKGNSPSWMEGLLQTHPPSEKRVETNLQNQALYPKHDFLGNIDYKTQLKTLFKTQFAYELHDKAITTKSSKKAKEWLKEAIKQEPNEALFHASLAKIYNDEGHKEKAFLSIKQALKLNMNNYDFHLLHGQLSFENNKFREAKSYFLNSIKLLDNPLGHFYLGKVYETEKNLPLAKAHYQVAARTDAGFSEKAAFRYAELDFDENPMRYVQITPFTKDTSGIWYRIRSKAPMKLGRLKINVFAERKLVETFYLESITPQEVVDHQAKLSLPTRILEKATLEFSIQTF